VHKLRRVLNDTIQLAYIKKAPDYNVEEYINFPKPTEPIIKKKYSVHS